MDHTLAVYLPMDRRHALAMGTPLLERTQGAALFADISGFTPLTEALTRDLGPWRGAEELPRQLNLVYDALIREVDRYGGSVIGFAGDAITCWFDHDTGLQATACGLAMQTAMRAFTTMQLPSGGTISLAVKVAVAVGMAQRLVVGDPAVQLIDTLAGATLRRMAAAERMAQQGELVLDEPSTHVLGEGLVIQEWRNDAHDTRFAVVSALRDPVAPQPWPDLAPDRLTAEAVRPWLLPTVYERLSAGQGEFLTELRPAVALFLRFDGIDYDSDPAAGQKLDAFTHWVQHLLAQYEGTLIQLTIGEKGSYLYATFGAPIAHEDDTRRAALAALALRSPPAELAFITAVQLGLTRGTMRTGAYGGTTRRTYGVLGDEVNLAARLMRYARPGQILVSGRIHAATESLFSWQALPEIRVRGKRDPIPLFALLDEAQSPAIHLTEPTYTLPMIGRAAERTLVEEKTLLAQRGQGQVVGITGEAGMGKSRLVAEAIRYAQAQGFRGYGGECQSYGTSTPYLVWQPIWRAFFHLEATDRAERQLEQVTQIIGELDPTLLPRLPLLAPVLGLTIPDNALMRAFDPKLRKASREALLVDLLKRRAGQLAAQQGAILLVLEDCHWLDGASHDLLETVARAIWDLPVLIVLAYRPPEMERLEAPRVTALDYFSLLPLEALSELEAAQLVADRLASLHPQEGQPPPASLLAALAERAQGNPFYLEELLNYLRDQGLDPYDPQVASRVALPTSLHSLILSRMDRLTEAQKVTLKVASIIGRLFRFSWLVGYYPALGEPAGVKRALEALSRLDLTPLDRPEPELTYLFKHIVTREVAYESLPYATRAALHEELAAYLEAQGAGTIDGYLDLLAYHYEHSEKLAKKCHYLRRAGEAAQATFANSAARDYYERLLPLLQEPDEQVEIHLRLGSVLELMGQWEGAEAHYQAARSLATAAALASAQAQSSLALGKLYRWQGQYEAAHDWLLQALAQWDALGESGARTQTLTELGEVALRQWDARAGEYLEQSRALCQQLGDQAGLAYALNALSSVARSQGNLALAQARLEESLLLHRALGSKPGIARALNNLGNLALDQGNLAEGQALHEESLALRREMGDKLGIAISLLNLGDMACQTGDPQSLALGQARLEESLALYRELGSKPGMVWSLNNLGYVAWRQADHVRARDCFLASLRLAQESEETGIIVDILLGLAHLASQQDDLASLRRTAWLLAALEQLRAALGSTLQPWVQAVYDEALSTARAGLDATDFAAAWAEGQALSLREVVSLILSGED